jgi:hypothetical protein
MTNAVPLIRFDFNDWETGGGALRQPRDHTGEKIALHEGMKVVLYQHDGLWNEACEMVSGFMIYRATIYQRPKTDPAHEWGARYDEASWSWVENLDAISPAWISGLRDEHYRPRAPQGSLIETYRSKMVGLPVTHIWGGHGSALFLEFGDLKPQTKRDGSPGHPQGQYSIMMDWDWRIADETSILCDSSGDDGEWPAVFAQLIGRTLENIALFSGGAELAVMLSGGYEILPLNNEKKSPDWAVFDNAAVRRWICAKSDRLIVEERETDTPSSRHEGGLR